MSESFDNTDTFIGGNEIKNTSFFEYITSFNTKEKNQLLNLLQYGGLCVIPLLIVLKLMKQYIPTSDPFKSSTELLIEVIIQLLVVIVAFFFVHKLVLYVPTYSKVDYDNISLLSMILPLFFLMFTLDTNISEKLNILFDRLLIMIGIKKEGMEEKNHENDENRPQLTQNSVGQCGSQTPLVNPPVFENRLIDGHPTKREVDTTMTSQMMPQGGNDMMGGMNNGCMIDNGSDYLPANCVLGSSY